MDSTHCLRLVCLGAGRVADEEIRGVAIVEAGPDLLSRPRDGCIHVSVALEPPDSICRDGPPDGRIIQDPMGRRAVFQLRLYRHLDGRCALDVVGQGKLPNAAAVDRGGRAQFPGIHVLQCHRRIRIRLGALAGPKRVCAADDSIGPNIVFDQPAIDKTGVTSLRQHIKVLDFCRSFTYY
jgi:hypothetical protein